MDCHDVFNAAKAIAIGGHLISILAISMLMWAGLRLPNSLRSAYSAWSLLRWCWPFAKWDGNVDARHQTAMRQFRTRMQIAVVLLLMPIGTQLLLRAVLRVCFQ
jgi:hypothetical protein